MMQNRMGSYLFLVTIKGTFCSIHKWSTVKIANVYWVQQPRQAFYYLRGFLISRRELYAIVYFPFLLEENEEDRPCLKGFYSFPNTDISENEMANLAHSDRKSSLKHWASVFFKYHHIVFIQMERNKTSISVAWENTVPTT